MHIPEAPKFIAIDRLHRVTTAARSAGAAAVAATQQVREKAARSLSPELAKQADLALIDARTNAGSPHAFDMRLLELATANKPFAVILVDIDKFKDVNSQVGHAYADVILGMFVEGINERIRKGDAVFPSGDLFRTGGDEFTILAPLEARVDESQTQQERLDTLLGRLDDQYFSGHEFVTPGGEAVTIHATAKGVVVSPEQLGSFPAILNELSTQVLAAKER
jgi:diguanylate cyclase (GGDEF)-like protein